MRGKIKWYNSYKKYGFISGEDGRDIFFTSREIRSDEFIDDQPVEYELNQNDKGTIHAINIILLKRK
jgi:CspA family cold shock protein